MIAAQYKTLTGRDLKVAPTAFVENRTTKKQKLVIGESLLMEENSTELSGTDWVMTHIATMLPEEQRGYYKDKVKNIEK